MTDQPTFTPEQFRQAQQELGLSDAQMAFVLGMENVDNVRRYKVTKPGAPSHRAVKPWTARLLKAYLDGYRPADWPGDEGNR